MSHIVRVGMADLNVCKAPEIITTLGLGSCIGLTLYDPRAKIGTYYAAGQYEGQEQFQSGKICRYGNTGAFGTYDTGRSKPPFAGG